MEFVGKIMANGNHAICHVLASGKNYVAVYNRYTKNIEVIAIADCVKLWQGEMTGAIESQPQFHRAECAALRRGGAYA